MLRDFNTSFNDRKKSVPKSTGNHIDDIPKEKTIKSANIAPNLPKRFDGSALLETWNQPISSADQLSRDNDAIMNRTNHKIHIMSSIGELT